MGEQQQSACVVEESLTCACGRSWAAPSPPVSSSPPAAALRILLLCTAYRPSAPSLSLLDCGTPFVCTHLSTTVSFMRTTDEPSAAS